MKIKIFVIASVLLGLFVVSGAVQAAPADKVTICHATDAGTFQRIVVSGNAIGGHFENNGTPKSGHEDDLLFSGDVPCPGDPTPTPSVTPTTTATPTPSVTPTPPVTPTPTPTPTPIPTATLHVVKIVVNDNGGMADPDDFTLHVAGSDFVGMGAPGTMFALAAGTYTVTEDANPDYLPTFGGDCDVAGMVTLASGDDKTCTVTNDDIPGEIHGSKFEDMDGDGMWDMGEPGLEGWVINLYDAGMTWLASTSTDMDGHYMFEDLDVGTYNAREILKAGWTQTTTDPAPIAIGLGDMIMGVDFGNFDNVSISGFKWYDKNGNTVWDMGEPALAGWTITLDGSSSMVTTSSLGYAFEDVGPGTHEICETMQSGWRQTYPGADMCHTIVVETSGEDMSGVNFGNISDFEGTIGFWRNWNKHKKYSAVMINAWLVTIDGTSKWLMSEAGYGTTTSEMVKLIDDATKRCSKLDPTLCAKKKFLAQYMTTRLDIMSGKKTEMTWYAVPADAQMLLGLDGLEYLGDIVDAVESWVGSGLRSDYLILANLFDSINNTGLN